MSRFRPDHVLIAVAVLFADLAAWPWLPSAASPAPTPVTAIMPPPVLPELPPLGHFAAIEQLPLFSPSRQPHNAERPGVAAPAGIEARYRVVGLIITGSSRRALLIAGERKIEVGEGDTLDGWKVVRIEPDRMLLSSPAGEAILTLRRPASETSTGKPAQ